MFCYAIIILLSILFVLLYDCCGIFAALGIVLSLCYCIGVCFLFFTETKNNKVYPIRTI